MADRIFAIVGLCGVGKSEATQVLNELGCETVYFGGIVLEELASRGLEATQANERLVRESLRRTHDMAAMAKLAEPKLFGRSKVVIDGLYSFAEYLHLKENSPSE